MAAEGERLEPGESEEEDVYEVERIIDMREEEVKSKTTCKLMISLAAWRILCIKTWMTYDGVHISVNTTPEYKEKIVNFITRHTVSS